MQNHFNIVVAGDNPDEILKKYSNTLKVKPYTVFKIADAGKYKQKHLDTLTKIIENCEDERMKLSLEVEFDRITNLDDIGYYLELTENYELDEATGDVILDKNPNGKFDYCRLGKDLCMPMKDYNDNEIFQARKKDINWEKIHLYNTWTYEIVWDMCVEGKEPKNENERNLYENMKNRKDYFNFFKTKENYVKHNTSFWGFAFVDENGWYEMDDNISQIEWVNNFYEKFIVPLPEDTLISIYECYKS